MNKLYNNINIVIIIIIIKNLINYVIDETLNGQLKRNSIWFVGIKLLL